MRKRWSGVASRHGCGGGVTRGGPLASIPTVSIPARSRKGSALPLNLEDRFPQGDESGTNLPPVPVKADLSGTNPHQGAGPVPRLHLGSEALPMTAARGSQPGCFCSVLPGVCSTSVRIRVEQLFLPWRGSRDSAGCPDHLERPLYSFSGLSILIKDHDALDRAARPPTARWVHVNL
jgi:hypothetical protein